MENIGFRGLENPKTMNFRILTARRARRDAPAGLYFRGAKAPPKTEPHSNFAPVRVILILKPNVIPVSEPGSMCSAHSFLFTGILKMVFSLEASVF
jgi:hypothetical protein